MQVLHFPLLIPQILKHFQIRIYTPLLTISTHIFQINLLEPYMDMIHQFLGLITTYLGSIRHIQFVAYAGTITTHLQFLLCQSKLRSMFRLTHLLIKSLLLLPHQALTLCILGRSLESAKWETSLIFLLSLFLYCMLQYCLLLHLKGLNQLPKILIGWLSCMRKWIP